MEKTFRKTTIGLFSLLMVSMMLVSAGVYPVPFTNNNEANVAVVYGANAAATDSTAADNLVNSLANTIITEEEFERIFSAGVVDDEVRLGDKLGSAMRYTFTDNHIPSLFDGRIDWDDGEDTDDYNVHEEIIIGDIKLQTTFDNEDFEGVVLINDRDLEYRLVFEEAIFVNNVGTDNDRELGGDADALELTILGEEYLIEEVGSKSITVTKAKKIFLSEGDTTTIDGRTLTIDSIYGGSLTSSGSIFVNGILIKEGEKETVNGIEVKVDEVYYTAKDSGVSKVEIYAGGDISEEYSDGDAFIGQDEDDPEWVWSISNPGEKDGWIGVKYDLRQVDEEDDVVYEGGEYIFPNGFATVSFDSLTDVEYHNFEVLFDDVDLYEKGDKNENNETYHNDVDVVIIKGENEDSFELGADIETDTLYLWKIDANSVSVYYMDLAEDYSTGKPVFYKTIEADNIIETTEIFNEADFNQDGIVDTKDYAITLTFSGKGCIMPDWCNGTDMNQDGIVNYIDFNNFRSRMGNVSTVVETVVGTSIMYTDIATLIADDTDTMKVGISGTDSITLTIGDIEISLGGNSSFLYLGATAEDAEGTDVIVNEKPIGTKDNDIMDHYGTIIESPENNADDDKVVFKVPSEQVYAQISVLGSEEDTVTNVTFVKPTPAELNIAKITDGNAASASNKNIIVVGGSCINTMAASLLGGKFCGEDFTANTGVDSGQALIQTFDIGDGKVATLVAGYNAADTQRAVQHLLSTNLNIAVGEKVII